MEYKIDPASSPHDHSFGTAISAVQSDSKGGFASLSQKEFKLNLAELSLVYDEIGNIHTKQRLYDSIQAYVYRHPSKFIDDIIKLSRQSYDVKLGH